MDDAVDLVEELPATVVRRVLQNTKPETRKLDQPVLNHPEKYSRKYHDGRVYRFEEKHDGGTVFRLYPSPCREFETIYTCYVMDEKRMLDGVVTVKDLLLQPYERLVGDIMDTHVIKACDDR